MSFIITPTDPHAGGGLFGNSGAGSDNGDGLRPVSDHRGPLRHLLIGTPQRLRAAIRLLHACRYLESHEWTPFMGFDPEGLLIRPTAREVYTYVDLPPRRD